MGEETLLPFVDIALIFIALELVVLVGLRVKGRGMALTDVSGHLAAGAFLLLALRAVLMDAGAWAFGFLLLSWPTHLLDLRRRWRSRRA